MVTDDDPAAISPRRVGFDDNAGLLAHIRSAHGGQIVVTGYHRFNDDLEYVQFKTDVSAHSHFSCGDWITMMAFNWPEPELDGVSVDSMAGDVSGPYFSNHLAVHFTFFPDDVLTPTETFAWGTRDGVSRDALASRFDIFAGGIMVLKPGSSILPAEIACFLAISLVTLATTPLALLTAVVLLALLLCVADGRGAKVLAVILAIATSFCFSIPLVHYPNNVAGVPSLQELTRFRDHTQRSRVWGTMCVLALAATCLLPRITRQIRERHVL